MDNYYFIPNPEWAYTFKENLLIKNMLNDTSINCNSIQTNYMKELFEHKSLHELKGDELGKILENIKNYNLGYWTTKKYGFELSNDFVFNRYIQYTSLKVESLHININELFLLNHQKMLSSLKDFIDINIPISIIYINKAGDFEILSDLLKFLCIRSKSIVVVMNCGADCDISTKFAEEIEKSSNVKILSNNNLKDYEFIHNDSNYSYLNTTSYVHNSSLVNNVYYGSIILTNDFRVVNPQQERFNNICSMQLSNYIKDSKNLSYWTNN